MTKKPNSRDEQGQTMVEFALVLPVLVTLLFGIIQFGVIFNNYVTITDAARAGARKAAVSRNSGDPVGDCTSQVRSSANGLDQAKLAVTCSYDPSMLPGTDVTVEADYPYDISVFGIPVTSGTLKTVMKERLE